MYPTSKEIPFASDATLTSTIPGLHIIANFRVTDIGKLTNYRPFEKFINEQIVRCHLSKVGEVYHDFEAGGYTGVVCLTESHLSIHTWPEKQYLTFDIFLSNHLKDNSAVTLHLYEQVKEYFSAVAIFEQIIER